MEMEFKSDNWRVKVVDEPMYTFGSVDNPRSYTREYLLTDELSCVSSKHGVIVDDISAVMGASGGCSAVHADSGVVIADRFYVAVGDHACCICLPELELQWSVLVDSASCFGLHYSCKHGCLLSHGELEIVRLSLDGKIVWSTGGKDIFTEAFILHNDYIEAVDFNHERYHIDIQNGKSAIVPD